LTKVNDNDKEQSQEFPKTIVDDMGREVVINKQPQRIVSLAPSNTEILFALELTDQIVGVTEYCNYPEEALTKTKVGSFSEPNIEKIVELEPDLVFATSMHKKTVEQLEKLDISVFVVNPSNISEIINSIKKVGDATGRSEAAGQLTADMQSRIEAVKEKTEKLKEEDKPLVYYELWDDPVMSAGPGSFVDSLITLAGGINLAGDAEGKYPKLSEEVVIERNPDIIIHQYDHGSNKIENIADRPGWQNITAIKQGKIYGIDPDIVNRPGPRIVDALEKFFEYIHPELAK
jgi:iron complex transport system substrate-binding protein